MKQVMFIKSVPIHTPTLSIQENGFVGQLLEYVSTQTLCE